MDIWGWVYEAETKLRENGNEKLADYMDSLPSDTVNSEHDKLDNYVKEAIELARQEGLNWVELFLRHWYLQSKILHRHEPKDMIKEAVSLLEFSSRDDNRDCPQSMCVVQDLGSCYGIFDGPGYVEERLAVASESLQKINPDWPCYSCIAAEYADALYDAKRFDECLTFLKKIDQDYVDASLAKDTSGLLLTKVQVFAVTNKSEKARKLVKNVSSWSGGSSFAFSVTMTKAFIEVHDKQYQKAFELLPTFAEAKESPEEFHMWAEIKYYCILNLSEIQTADNIQQLYELALDMERRGAYRQAFDVFGWVIELIKFCKSCQSDLSVTDILAKMTKLKSLLNKDLGATARIDALSCL
jgi:tetratricopeptide (TPR) repeat protein